VHLTHKGIREGGSTIGRAAPASKREAARRSRRAALELARPPGRADLMHGDDDVGARRQLLAAGQLVVRWERGRAAPIIWLSGALDRATVTLLDRELDARAIGTKRLIVDLTGLEFIDIAGLDRLIRIQQRASERGARLSFRRGPHVAQAPLQLTGTLLLRSRSATRHAGVSHQESTLARARARADVDHEPHDDRPRAA
jgi:anti-anti-sigma factor